MGGDALSSVYMMSMRWMMRAPGFRMELMRYTRSSCNCNL